MGQSGRPDVLTPAGIQPAVAAGRSRAVRQHVWPIVASGRFVSVIDSVLPLAVAAEAHRRLESGAHAGEVVLAV